MIKVDDIQSPRFERGLFHQSVYFHSKKKKKTKNKKSLKTTNSACKANNLRKRAEKVRQQYIKNSCLLRGVRRGWQRLPFIKKRKSEQKSRILHLCGGNTGGGFARNISEKTRATLSQRIKKR
eukprot:TRINITY_DN3490_c0_g1_i1.p1 TRINITY_DN3490_c0_g1~~TRINITY_DN3490_c0_g1_i1.p1  ORF type:complete len:123 (-),score=4.78 TRINITY_DN3490_c0_g1_i1:239-607(-)